MTKTASKFTAGEWRTDRYKSRVLAYVRNEDGGLEPFCVADCDQSRHLDVYLGHGERHANVHLIVAAPKMYELLSAAISICDFMDAGVLVRSTKHDDDPQWAMKQIPLVKAIKGLSEARRIKAAIDQEKE